MNVYIGTLAPDETDRLQLVDSKIEAMKVKPEGYSTFEIEQQFLAKCRLIHDLAAKHGIDGHRAWQFDVYTGALWYTD